MLGQHYPPEENLHKLDQKLDPEKLQDLHRTLQEGAKNALLEAADMMRLWVYLEELRTKGLIADFSKMPHFEQLEEQARLRKKAFSGNGGSAKEDIEAFNEYLREYCEVHNIDLDESAIREDTKTLLYGEANEASTSDIVIYVRRGVDKVNGAKVTIRERGESDALEREEDFIRLHEWLCEEMEVAHLEGEAMAELYFMLRALEEKWIHFDVEKTPQFRRALQIMKDREESRTSLTGIDAHIRALVSALETAGEEYDITPRSIEEGVENLLLSSDEYF